VSLRFVDKDDIFSGQMFGFEDSGITALYDKMQATFDIEARGRQPSTSSAVLDFHGPVLHMFDSYLYSLWWPWVRNWRPQNSELNFCNSEVLAPPHKTAGSMRDYALGRLAMLAPTLLLASLLTFLMLRVVPGDAAVAKAGFAATNENVAALRAELGLDRPYFPISFSREKPFVSGNGENQFGSWLGGAIRFDFGTSTTYGDSVSAEIRQRIPVTLELVILSALLTIAIGVPAGILAAARQNTWIDALTRSVAVFGVSVPSFFLGTIMLLFPAIWWQWAPPATYEHFWNDPSSNLQMFLLPSVALAAAYASTVMRLTCSAMLDVLRNDYVRTARAKGLRERQVIARHAIKNAMIPVATFVGLQIITMITGAVIVEQVFNLNGIGKLLFTSIFSRDYPMVQGLVLFFAVIVLLTNLVVDLLYGWIDPRVRYT
jgi:peptide/nickel transport system permease protein